MKGVDLSADDGAADDHAQDLAGAFADLQKLCITVEALHVELVAVAVAAVDLDAVVADFAGRSFISAASVEKRTPESFMAQVSQIIRSVARIFAAMSANLKPTA